ncbi:unnamed protein product [Amoebophrya sp. A120]|nr:unnamed protein product [Amoebophrya sp. A120]|eukprot:GSA120T00004584001.1
MPRLTAQIGLATEQFVEFLQSNQHFSFTVLFVGILAVLLGGVPGCGNPNPDGTTSAASSTASLFSFYLFGDGSASVLAYSVFVTVRTAPKQIPQYQDENSIAGRENFLDLLVQSVEEKFSYGAANTFPYSSYSSYNQNGQNLLDSSGSSTTRPPGRIPLLGEISRYTAPELFSPERKIAVDVALKNVLHTVVNSAKANLINNSRAQVLTANRGRATTSRAAGRQPEQEAQLQRQQLQVRFKELIAVADDESSDEIRRAAAVALELTEAPLFVKNVFLDLQQRLLSAEVRRKELSRQSSVVTLLANGNDYGGSTSTGSGPTGNNIPWRRKAEARDWLRREYGTKLLGGEYDFFLNSVELWAVSPAGSGRVKWDLVEKVDL